MGEAEIIQGPHETDEIADLSKFEHVLLDESYRDVNLDWEWSLAQQGAINFSMAVDSRRN